MSCYFTLLYCLLDLSCGECYVISLYFVHCPVSEVISSFKSLRAGVCSPYVVSLCDFAYYVVG